MRNGGSALRMGWKPGTGFNGFGNWIGYNEAMILYILAPRLADAPGARRPTLEHLDQRLPVADHYGQSYVVFPPLFGHQYSHCWIDFRNIQDAYMRARGASPTSRTRGGRRSRSRPTASPTPAAGSATAPTCGASPPRTIPTATAPTARRPPRTTTAPSRPTAPASSIPFAPEIVIPTLHNIYDTYGPAALGPVRLQGRLQPSRRTGSATDYIGIDQGPIVIMIENYLNGGSGSASCRTPTSSAG